MGIRNLKLSLAVTWQAWGQPALCKTNKQTNNSKNKTTKTINPTPNYFLYSSKYRKNMCSQLFLKPDIVSFRISYFFLDNSFQFFFWKYNSVQRFQFSRIFGVKARCFTLKYVALLWWGTDRMSHWEFLTWQLVTGSSFKPRNSFSLLQLFPLPKILMTSLFFFLSCKYCSSIEVSHSETLLSSDFRTTAVFFLCFYQWGKWQHLPICASLVSELLFPQISPHRGFIWWSAYHVTP